MSTVLGWECTTGITELSEHSIRNWPIQATGAEILRIACIMAERHGIEVVAPVHDAVLIEGPLERIDATIEAMREIMRRASRIVLNATPDGPHELRTSLTVRNEQSAPVQRNEQSAPVRSGTMVGKPWQPIEHSLPDRSGGNPGGP